VRWNSVVCREEKKKGEGEEGGGARTEDGRLGFAGARVGDLRGGKGEGLVVVRWLREDHNDAPCVTRRRKTTTIVFSIEEVWARLG
jgi:hypothetical protein